jgi:uncharacterized repeat protein (TIGR01451 family)
MPLALCAMLLLGFSEGLQGETPCSSKSTIKLQTDRLHYLPSETVHITGSGFASSCRVTLVINRPDGTSGGDLLFTTDATGGFSYSFVMTGLKGTYTDSVFGKNRALLAGSTFTNGSTVMTDKSDYHPGETVTITGNRWLAGETVALLVRENTGVPDRTFYATVNASGDFVNKDLLITPADIGARFVVTATGQTSGFTARTTFMDSLASDCFRTVASGNWNSTSTWESAPTPGCTVWASATLTPTSAASTITIQSGHTADVTANVTVDQVTVASGGDLEIDTGVILALNHAGTPDLLVNGTVGVTGTLTQQTGTTGSYVEVGGTGRLTVNSGGLINGTGGSLATVSSFQVDSGGQWTINSGGSLSAGGGNGMAVIVNSGGTATWNGPVAIGTTMTLNGTVNASANVTVNSVSNLQIGGTVTMTAGTLAISRGNGGTLGSINSGGSLIFQGSSAFTLGSVGSFSVASGGTIDFGPSTTVSGGASLATVAGANVKIGSTTGVNGNITSGRSFDNGTNWTFDGTAAQVTGTFLPVTVGKLTINNSGPATVTLGAAVVTQTVSGLLTVTSGTFDQGASANLVATGGISIASGATYKNVGTGDLTLGAGVANAGTIQLNAGGVACPSVGADSILIRSSVAGTQRAWSGAGSFDLQNVDVKDQAGTASIQVKSGTDSGNNGSNWTFTGCPTQIRVETAANGSGVVVPAQSVASGSTLTVFSISRDASNNFVANVAADSWSLVSVTGGVVAGDLVAAGDSKSATFTGHLVGTAVIHAVVSGLTSTDSGTITVTGGTTADLSIGNTAGAARAFTCSTITYTIVVTNNGPNAVTGATVTDTFPADLTAVTWTCIASGGSSCGAGSGSGNISTTVNLANGGTATLTATGTVAQTTDGTMSNTASVAVPGGVTDPNGSNNSGTVTTSLNTWVNNAAGSDSNEGTSDAPYASIAMAASVIGNSGNVLVQVGNSQAGTPYAANISISGPGLNGTASCKTLFQGITDVNGNEPLIRGTDPTVDAGFDVASNDVDIEHFQIENTLVALMAEPSTTRVVFAHNFVRVPDLAYGTLLYSSSNALVEDNRVEAASSNSFFGVWDYSGSGNTLDGNKVSGHGNAGIRSDLSTGLIVRRNITKGNVIGLHMAGATGPATLYNNTVDGNSYLGIYAESPGGTVTSRNNIVTNNGVGWAWNGTGTVSSNYDDVFGNTSNYSYHGTVAAGGNSISANPVFVQTTDPTLPTYYQLSSGSPCINAGTDVGLPYSGPAPDIGAVEVP